VNARFLNAFLAFSLYYTSLVYFKRYLDYPVGTGNTAKNVGMPALRALGCNLSSEFDCLNSNSVPSLSSEDFKTLTGNIYVKATSPTR